MIVADRHPSTDLTSLLLVADSLCDPARLRSAPFFHVITEGTLQRAAARARPARLRFLHCGNLDIRNRTCVSRMPPPPLPLQDVAEAELSRPSSRTATPPLVSRRAASYSVALPRVPPDPSCGKAKFQRLVLLTSLAGSVSVHSFVLFALEENRLNARRGDTFSTNPPAFVSRRRFHSRPPSKSRTGRSHAISFPNAGAHQPLQ